ncbi:MAG: DNA recombination protein RmuC [Bacteroidetes bacterium]|jgi:DNA recombination protein RmuC|nr:DNA recombination protein RmuC [Bacteroidota bacterium]
MDIVYLLVGIAIGFALAWFIKKSQQKGSSAADEAFIQLRTQLGEESNLRSGLQSQNEYIKQENESLKGELKQNQTELLKLNNELSTTREESKNLVYRMSEQKQELTQLKEQFTKEFENLANKIFEEKTQKFADQNKTNLSEILTPLGEKIKDFEKKVNDVYVNESKDRASLKEQLNMLQSLNQQMSKETQNLTKALKGETKTQGNWGEFILESVLEKSGLVKDREYSIQQSFTTEEGKRYQPDVIINLPEGKTLIVDSKVSLVAYEKFWSSEDETQKTIALKEHLQSLRNHIKGLSDKNYQNLYEVKSLDFVILFVPIEPAFALAMQADPALFNEAFDKNIVIVSPSTLLVTLKTVASIWRFEYQNRNAIDIAKKAGDLHDKFVGFVDDLIGLGNKMRDSQKAYEGAMNKLSTGAGNIVKRTDELRKLGAKASKSLPQTLLDRAGDE